MSCSAACSSLAEMLSRGDVSLRCGDGVRRTGAVRGNHEAILSGCDPASVVERYTGALSRSVARGAER